jgi:hypothetical protein
MTSSLTSSRRILFNNIKELVSDSIDDEAWDFCDCRCDEEIRNEIFNDQKKEASIMIIITKKSDLRVRQ